jgi:hypothetical protein
VRAYAHEVGLDPDAVVVSFVDALEQNAREAAARDAIRPEITADDRRFAERQQRALFWLRGGLVAVVVLLTALALWRFGPAHRDGPAEVADSTADPAPVPVPSGSFAPPPSAPIGVAPAGAYATPTPAADPGQGVTAEVDAAPAAEEAPGFPTEPLPAAPGDPSAAPAVGEGDGGAETQAHAGSDGDAPTEEPSGESADALAAAARMVFDLTLSADCWISYSVDGGPPVAQLFRAGDRRRIEASQELLLDVGNAGALTLRIDGRRARPFGDPGDHVRRRITREDVAELIE